MKEIEREAETERERERERKSECLSDGWRDILYLLYVLLNSSNGTASSSGRF